MKKKSYIIILLIVCTFTLLFYLVNYFYNKGDDEILNRGDNNDVEISIQNEIPSTSTEFLPLIIKNVRLDNVTFGLDYEIQIKDGKRWLQFFKPSNIDELAVILEEGNSYEQKIYFEDNMNFIKNRTYRIIKVIHDRSYASNEFLIQ